jgi:hypothetical protein
MALSIFSWGFWGWGTATRQLLAAVDAVEERRGFMPPVFVDIRYRRSGRAPGFRGETFERLVGRRRYRWMPTLGNASIGTLRSARIACPMAADQLLDLALDKHEGTTRIIFFCACESPWASDCHRHMVSRLVLRSARRRRLSVEVNEWPGGTPSTKAQTIRVSSETLQTVARGAKAVPLSRRRIPLDFVGIPWGTLVVLKAGSNELPVVVGPAAFRHGSWVLPRFELENGPRVEDIRALQRQAAILRNTLRLG